MEKSLMQKNQIFNSLLHLSGLSDDLDAAIELMKIEGYDVSLNQLRNWRRSQNTRNYRPVPDFAFQVVFNYLFEMKRLNEDAFFIAINECIAKIKEKKTHN